MLIAIIIDCGRLASVHLHLIVVFYRDAARRCRKKKKFFMQSLEEKLKATTALNTQLQVGYANNEINIIIIITFYIVDKTNK